MNILRACFDWRVLTALAALGVGIFVVAPGIAAAVLPLLIVAACPLSMMVMMKSMGGHQKSPEAASQLEGGDRVAALRTELVELGRRQEGLAGELAAFEATQAAEPQPDTPVTPAQPAR